MCMRFVLFIFISTCLKTFVSAQDYVITVKGDSVAGKVKIEKIGIEKKLFVTTTDKKKLNYSMFQFRYAIINNVRYEAIKRGEVFDIVQVVKKGYLTLYAFQLDNQFSYDGYYLGKADGNAVEVSNLTFKRQMTRFLEDCPSVVNRLEEGEFKRTNLIELVDAYNACITQATLKKYAESVSTVNSKPWIELKEKLTASSFQNKESLLEMLEEIKNKKAKGEKIPNFLLSSFKSGIAADAALTDMFENLIQN
jgi:hypothetical protein